MITIEADYLYPCRTRHLFDQTWLEQLQKNPATSFRRGEQISYPGELREEIYLVTKGRVSIGHLHQDGKECILGILQEGDFVDLPSVFSSKESSVYTTALTEVEVVKVSKTEIRKQIAEKAELSQQLLTYFSNQLQEVVMILEQVAYDKVEERLIQALQRLIDLEKEEKGWYPLPKYITHKDMAGMIASTRETVTFLLNKFIQTGMVRNKNKQLWVNYALISS